MKETLFQRRVSRQITILMGGLAIALFVGSLLLLVLRYQDYQYDTFWLAFLLLLASITAGWGWWTAWRVIQTLRDLATAVTQINSGNLDFRLNIPRQDEIGELARAFDGMTEQLAQRNQEFFELHQQMEERVKARTQELEGANSRMEAIAEALYMTSQRANAANQAKSQFLANMSHELRTPLNSIIIYHDLLLRGGYGVLNDKQRDRLTKSRQSATLLMQLISDVLDLAKIEAGELVVKCEPTPLQPIFQACHGFIDPMLKNGQVQFKIETEPKLPSVMGDSQRIQQILLNLLSNAAKFTSAGKITLKAWEVRMENTPTLGIHEIPAEHCVAIAVSDTGIGIPADMQETVFEEFKQVDDSNTREAGGTGLGLAIVKKLVKAQAGSISLRSRVGVGSTFTVLLPVAATPPPG